MSACDAREDLVAIETYEVEMSACDAREDLVASESRETMNQTWDR
jgi:hypothetical protein